MRNKVRVIKAAQPHCCLIASPFPSTSPHSHLGESGILLLETRLFPAQESVLYSTEPLCNLLSTIVVV
ncbi:hypothetical protein RSOLAG1IB_01025 [Rhizoctonia solani AG-1 IB]|jgi:hypothetical protein|uniref:Uncharacterized protein n=1 Tax=Thanatephorus cucumeris (strain AG1-IB / isolate 7/3/14) TaxID=1108050 RepID=A0A0B7F6C3_THACB|nr:hypothetical protein RSOLAG1IB_01025 [Rhizoctonia solani AG-1 IB]